MVYRLGTILVKLAISALTPGNPARLAAGPLAGMRLHGILDNSDLRDSMI